MADVVIFGAGEGARIAARTFRDDGRHSVVAFTVDAAMLKSDTFEGRQVVPFDQVESLFPPSQVSMFVALGFRQMNSARAAKFTEAKAKGYTCVSYVDDGFKLPPETTIGENCFILAGQCIDRDVAIGDNVTIWSGCHIGDRSVIGNDVWLSSHVCLNGDVVVEDRCFLASNCTISPGVRLAPRSFIGANALITRNTTPGAVHTVPPTPAQPMESDRFMAMLRMT